MNIKKYVWITTSFEGFHNWPLAPPEVSFLRSMHRHIFHVKIRIEVFDNDRDIEFILFKREVDCDIKTYIGTELGSMSCEDVSDTIHNMINNKYPNRDMIIEVSEDGENGSYIEYNK